MDRRDFFAGIGLAGGSLALAAASAPAHAQDADESRFDRIMRTKKLRLGAAVTEPWYFKDVSGGEGDGAVVSGGAVWRGVGPQVGKAIAEAMGVELEIVETTWAGAVAALQGDEFDCMFALSATPQRALALDFLTAAAGYVSNAALLPDGIEIATWDDLNDPKYRVGVTLGSDTDHFVTARLPKSTIVRTQNNPEVFAAFQAKRIDVAVLSSAALTFAHKRLGVGRIVLLKPPVVIPLSCGLAVADNRRFYDYLNTVVAYLYSSGDTQTFYENYLRFREIEPSTAVPLIREWW